MGLLQDSPPPIHPLYPSLPHLPTECLAAVGGHLDSADLASLARTDTELARHLGALPGDAARATDLWADLYGAAYRARVPVEDATCSGAGNGRGASASARRRRLCGPAGGRPQPPLPCRDAYLRAEAAARGWRLRGAPPTHTYALFPAEAGQASSPAALSAVTVLLPLSASGGGGAPGWSGAAAIVGGSLAVVPPLPPRRAALAGASSTLTPTQPALVPSVPVHDLTCLAVAPLRAGADGVRLVGGATDRFVRVWSSEPDGGVSAAGRAARGWVGGGSRSPSRLPHPLGGVFGDGGGSGTTAAAASAADAAAAAVAHPPRVLRGHTSAVTAVATHPDVPKLAATGGRDGTVRLWRNKAAGAPLRGAGDWVTALAWVGGGKAGPGGGGGRGGGHLVAGTRGGALALWDVTARAAVATAAVPPPAGGASPPVAVSGPVVYAAAAGAAVHVWDTRVPASSAAAAVLSAPPDVVATGRSRRRVAITSLAVSPDGSVGVGLSTGGGVAWPPRASWTGWACAPPGSSASVAASSPSMGMAGGPGTGAGLPLGGEGSSSGGAPGPSTAPSPLHTVAVCRHRLVGACAGGVLAWSLSDPEGTLPAVVAGGGGGEVTSAAVVEGGGGGAGEGDVLLVGRGGGTVQVVAVGAASLDVRGMGGGGRLGGDGGQSKFWALPPVVRGAP